MPTARPIPVFYIGKIRANNMIENFLNNKYAALNATLSNSRQDTKTIWYSVGHFEEMYKELVYLNADGVRFYFGAYPEGTLTDSEDDISNQLCILMVPTFLNGEGKQQDIILEETPNFDERPGHDLVEEENSNNLGHGSGNRGFDQGKPCPPLCDDEEPGFPLP